jgi:hypothetical protein
MTTVLRSADVGGLKFQAPKFKIQRNLKFQTSTTRNIGSYASGLKLGFWIFLEFWVLNFEVSDPGHVKMWPFRVVGSDMFPCQSWYQPPS